MAANSWGNIGVALRHRHYRTYQTGRFISMLTTWMYRIAVGWIAWRLTGSATWLGLFGFLDQATAIVILPLAGALADRADALKYMRVTQALLLAQAVGLGVLDELDLLSIPVLMGFTVLFGSINAAQQPAAQSILPNLMPKEVLTVAYGVNSLLFNVARFVGPMAAGGLISAFGTAPAIFCNAIGAALFSLCLMFMQADYRPPPARSGKARNMWLDLRDGVGYATRHEGIGPTMAILSALALMPFTIDLLLPSLADGVYHAGAGGLAWMTAAMAAGAMTQASLVARRSGVKGLSGYAIGAIVFQAFAFVGLAASGSMWLALVCIAAIGFAASATRVSSMTLLQYSVEIDMRARVASFYLLITSAVPALGALGVGGLVDLVGMRAALLAIAVYTLGVWLLAARGLPRIRAALEVEADQYRGRGARGAAPALDAKQGGA